MDAFWNFAGNYWWLIFVFGGTVGGAFRALGAANERRAKRRLERYRIKHESKAAIIGAMVEARADKEATRREIDKTVDEHNETDARWFGYEIDLATLLDFPMMTDLRDPLTVAFHRAKRHADLLRPVDSESLVKDRQAREAYRDSVHEYAIAFDVAETEAKRRRRSDFAPQEQQRLARAQGLLRLALDDAATPQERQSAYAKARKELEGLVVLPTAGTAALERRVAGELES